jgi:hypothetical protein
MWESKDKMEITAGEQLLFAVIKPLLLYETLAFGTMPVSA